MVRGGARSGARRLVVHLSTTPPDDGSAPPRAGLVVSKAVGGAVERTLVKRRLRGLLAERLGGLEQGDRVVVRALPAAHRATSAELGSDLDAALAGARRRANRPGRRSQR